MYMLRNKVQLIGCLCSDPEVKLIEKGKKWARLLLATRESYRDDQGKRITETQYHTLIAWDKLAEMAKRYLCKGKEIAVEGKLVSRSYIDNQGIKQHVTEIMVYDVLLLRASTAPKATLFK